MSNNHGRKRIGELLIERKLIDEKKLEKGLERQKETGKLIGECLVELGYIDEEMLTQTLAAQFGMPFISLKNYNLDPKIVSKFPSDIMRKESIVPLDKIGRITTLAVCDLLTDEEVSRLENILQGKIKCFLATVSDLKQAIDKYFAKNK